MSPVMCECGAMLIKDIDEHGVTTLDGNYIVFQRKTDHVACAQCFRSYAIVDLRPSSSPKPEG